MYVETNSYKINYKGEIVFKLDTDKKLYTFSYSIDNNEFIEMGKGMTAGLCTEATHEMSFTGTYIGIFSERCEAYFDYFKYHHIN